MIVQRRNIWVVGGDERQVVLAGLLADDGHRVHVMGMEREMRGESSLDGIESADCVVFPLPAVNGRGEIHTPLSDAVLRAGDVLARLRPGQMLLAGRATAWLRGAAESCGLTLLDYFEQEELTLLNAIPTAEGAIRIAMEVLPVTLHGSSVLVLGFGRVGQALAPRMRALGAKVTVAARRKEQRALAAVMNLDAESTENMKDHLHLYDLAINTVPAQMLGVEELAAMKEHAAVIDLASLPGGVDDESAAALGVKVIHALGLPGKEAPITAGRYLKDTVYHLIMGV